MFYNNIDPVLLRLGSLEIRYYGLFYLFGFIIAYFLIKKLAKERDLKLNEDDISDLLLGIIIGVVLGARLFYILFYNLNYYLQQPFEMFAIWHGGLSFHGGLVGAAIACYYFSKKKNIEFYDLADIIVIPASIGLALGRIGNFTNGELYGRITNLPWGVKFKDASGFRHPSQIYESIKNLIIFATLWNLRHKKLPRGFLFWTFVTMYGALRFLIEFVREPDPQLGFIFGPLTMGQLLTLPMFVIGLVMLFKNRV